MCSWPKLLGPCVPCLIRPFLEWSLNDMSQTRRTQENRLHLLLSRQAYIYRMIRGWIIYDTGTVGTYRPRDAWNQNFVEGYIGCGQFVTAKNVLHIVVWPKKPFSLAWLVADMYSNSLGGGSLWYRTDCGTIQTVLLGSVHSHVPASSYDALRRPPFVIRILSTSRI